MPDMLEQEYLELTTFTPLPPAKQRTSLNAKELAWALIWRTSAGPSTVRVMFSPATKFIWSCCSLASNIVPVASAPLKSTTDPKPSEQRIFLYANLVRLHISAIEMAIMSLIERVAWFASSKGVQNAIALSSKSNTLAYSGAALWLKPRKSYSIASSLFKLGPLAPEPQLTLPLWQTLAWSTQLSQTMLSEETSSISAG